MNKNALGSRTKSTLLCGFIGGCLTLLAVGCGPSPADFVGTYQVSYTLTATFQGQSSTNTGSGTLTISEASATDLVIVGDCSLPANISGATAFSVLQTACTTTTSSGGTMNWTISGSGTVVDGRLDLTLSGPATYTAKGATVSGNLSSTYTGNRL